MQLAPTLRRMNVCLQRRPSRRNFKSKAVHAHALHQLPTALLQTEHVVSIKQTQNKETVKHIAVKAPQLVDEEEWSYSDFRKAIKEDLVASVKISKGDSLLFAISKDGVVGTVRLPTDDKGTIGLIDEMMDHGVTIRYKDKVPQPSMFAWIINILIPFITWVFVFVMLRRLMGGSGNVSGGGLFGSGKGPGKFQELPATGITFDDIAGNPNAKQDLMEVVDFLKNPEKFAKFKVKAPNCILVGPPGVGKTLFAKAIAGEAKVPLFSASGSDFVQMFVGAGARNVRELFAEARKKEKCIIFIDEIDSLCKRRGGPNSFNGGSDEREQTLNQFLSEMDGFETHTGIVVIGATNRIDVLDPAVLRGGRFDRKVMIELPDYTGRIEILKVHTKGKPLSDDIGFDKLAKSCAGLSGADLANITNEAAIFALRNDKDVIEHTDFEHALDKMLMGSEKKYLIISEKAVLRE